MRPGRHWRRSSRAWRPAAGSGEGAPPKGGIPADLCGIGTGDRHHGAALLRGVEGLPCRLSGGLSKRAFGRMAAADQIPAGAGADFSAGILHGRDDSGRRAARHPEPSRFGSTSALLYGVNTLGATLGALLAGFFMPLWFGFRATCFTAMGMTVVVAALALLVSRSSPASQPVEDRKEEGDAYATRWLRMTAGSPTETGSP